MSNLRQIFQEPAQTTSNINDNHPSDLTSRQGTRENATDLGFDTSETRSTTTTSYHTDKPRSITKKSTKSSRSGSSPDAIDINEKINDASRTLYSSSSPTVSRRTKNPNHFSLRQKINLKNLNPKLVLENSGSVARDHLASERTFLAYVRTSLALSGMGVAIVQLFTIADLTSGGNGTSLSEGNRWLQKFARPIGVSAVLMALMVLAVAVYRYFLVQYALPDNKFPVARASIAFISFALGTMVTIIFAVMLSGTVNH